LRKIGTAEGFSIQKGHIFTQGDLYFYKGAFYFFLGMYQEALKLFIKSKNIKIVNSEMECLPEA
jgi:hypothetical protein